MNSNLLFDFSVNRESRTIRVKREFAANLKLVWDAWTKPEILDQWWAPGPWRAETKSMEFKEGGTRLYAMIGPNGERHWAIFNYHKIEKLKYFTGLDGFTDADGVLNTQLPRTNWKVSFIDRGETTLVETVLTFDNVEQLETLIRMGFKEGFTIALEGLDELLPAL